MPLAKILSRFQSLPLLPKTSWALLVLIPTSANSQVGGLVYILGPCESLQQTLLWGQEFLPLPQPPQVFTARGFEALFPCNGTLGCVAHLIPQLFLCFFSAHECRTTQSTSCHLASYTVHPGHPSLPLLPVWMNVSSLTPWLSDFHTVWFSGSSGCILVLNLLLSFFWLCEEANCIYLCLCLGWKSCLN